jgi:Flp pilus assembly protein TadD
MAVPTGLFSDAEGADGDRMASRVFQSAARGRAILAGAAVLAALLAVGLAVRKRGEPPADAEVRPPAPDDPRLTFATPFRNVRPGVGYVGDAACARCHRKLTDSYNQHPMGRSLTPMAVAARQERYGPDTHNPFTKFGFEYRIERRGDRVFHRETRRDGGGRVLAHTAAEVQFALGSQAHGRAYLIDRGGYVFQSPINWYAQADHWDTAPNVTEELSHAHFYRTAVPQCLHCHGDGVAPVGHTVNRYRDAQFRAIGCERCHGPGELHVRRHERHEPAEDVDDTIVNPRHLEPALREAVCQQCHLQGKARVERRGRRTSDFRPGLPFELFWSVFNSPPQAAGDNKAVSHVEQMYASRCFRASAGKLGCTSCHDPHSLPAPAQKVAFYRGRCLKCHAAGDCREKMEVRRPTNDDCTACHMPRARTTDIAHTASSDHRILRRPGDSPALPARRPLVAGVQLVAFHQDRLDLNDPGLYRDLGVALVHLAETRESGADARQIGRAALPLLDDAARRAPDDLPARLAGGYASWLVGRRDDALRAFEDVLAHDPAHETALMYAAALSAERGQFEAAADYWRRAVAVDPWSSHYHFRLAQALVGKQDWRGAADECRRSLELYPATWDARKLLIVALLRRGEAARAREEFDRMLGFFDPTDHDVLRRWFAQQRGGR